MLPVNRLKRAPFVICCRRVFSFRCPSAHVVWDRWASSLIKMLTISMNTFLGRSYPRRLHRLASSFTYTLQLWQMLSVMSIAVEDAIRNLPQSKSSVKDLLMDSTWPHTFSLNLTSHGEASWSTKRLEKAPLEL